MNNKLKRIITSVDLSPDWSHIALTDGEGAASLMNEAYVFKGIEPEIGALNDEQLKIIGEIGEEYIVKGIDINTSVKPDATHQPSKETSTKSVEKESDMSEELVKEMAEKLEAMTKALAVEKAERTLIPFGFVEVDATAVAKAIASLDQEDSEAVLKAFEELKTAAEESATKALKSEEENPVVKALAEEAGEAGEEEEVAEKSFVEKVKGFNSLVK